MEKEELLKELQSRLEDGFTVMSIDSVNFKPHPYCITPKHLERNNSMYLGQEQIEDMEQKYGRMCGVAGCTAFFGDHTHDTVLFLKLKRNLTKEEAGKLLEPCAGLLETNDIDGVAFVETPEKFRII